MTRTRPVHRSNRIQLRHDVCAGATINTTQAILVTFPTARTKRLTQRVSIDAVTGRPFSFRWARAMNKLTINFSQASIIQIQNTRLQLNRRLCARTRKHQQYRSVHSLSNRIKITPLPWSNISSRRTSKKRNKSPSITTKMNCGKWWTWTRVTVTINRRVQAT